MKPGIAAFAPRRLGQHPVLRAIPSDLHFQGVALYIDISGYSRLTNDLSNAGEEGLERLTALLDGAFGIFIETAEKWGGEVAYFAGDALLVYWAAEPTEYALPLSLALACVQELRAETTRLHAFSSASGLSRLGKPRMGLGLGSLRAMHVGTAARSYLLLDGQAVRDATAFQVTAAPGELRVSPRVAELLAVVGVASQAPGDLVDLTQYQPPAVPEQVDTGSQVPSASLFPKAVSRLSSRQDELGSAQLRPVTAVFLGIDGLAATAGLAVHQRLAETLEAAMRDTGEHGELLIDDKGVTYFLVFGALFNAAPDDPVRAARAALALHRAVVGLGYRCSAGLGCGMAYCGAIGTRTRKAYVTVGSPMNLAARLAGVAQDQVLVDENVASALPEECDVEALASLKVKGFASALRIGALRHVPEPSDAPFVGRSTELNTLEGWARQSEPSRSNLLLVGAAGLGKSRLLDEFTERHRRSGSRVHRGAAQPEEPGRALGEVLRSLFGVTTTSSSVSLERLESLIGAEEREFLPLYADLFGLEVADTTVSRGIVGDARVETRRRHVSRLMAQLAGDALLIFEDAHWMGSAELDILAFAGARYPGVRLLLSTRDEPEALERLSRRFDWQTLALSPVTEAEVELALTGLLGAFSVGPRLTRLVFQYAAGNPLAVQECVHLLSAAGHLNQIGGEWELSEDRASSIGVPESVQAMIASRVDYLPTTTQAVLKLASVFGGRFSADLLARVPGEFDQLAELESELKSLIRHHFLERVPGRVDYQFRHALIRDAAYHLMLVENRRQLHARVASALEPLPDTPLARLAEHFTLAQLTDKALEYSDRAGRVALKNGAYEEAIVLFSRCLELAPADTELLTRVRWKVRLADAHASLGDQAKRMLAAQEALELSGVRTSSSATWRTLSASLDWLRQLALTSAPGAISELPSRGADSAEQSRSASEALEQELGYAHCCVAEVGYFQNDVSTMFSSVVAAIQRTQSLGPSSTLSRAYAGMSILGVAAHRRLGHFYIGLALQTAYSSGDRAAQCYAHMVSALHAVGNGEWPIVRHSVAECQRLAVEVGDQTLWGIAEVISFWMDFYLNRPQTVSSADKLLKSALESGNRQQQVWAKRSVATVMLRAGETFEARRVLRDALALYQSARLHHLGELVPLRGTLALAESLCGNWEGAVTEAGQALLLASDSRAPAGHAMLLAWMAMAEALCTRDMPGSIHGRPAIARKQLFHQFSRHAWFFPMARPTLWYWKAQLATLREVEWLARRRLARSERYARALNMPLEARRITPL